MPRFVTQQHEKQSEQVHWDLMLEQGDVLKTFRLDKPPEDILVHPVRAAPIFDHPLKFLTYEGPVNKGLGRVHIVDQGTYELISQSMHDLKMILRGEVLTGLFHMHKTDNTWLFTAVPANQ